MGDVARNVTGFFCPDGAKEGYTHMKGFGAFYVRGTGTYNFNNASTAREVSTDHEVVLDPSRVVPTGAVNVPRSFGAVLCAYLGQPTAT